MKTLLSARKWIIIFICLLSIFALIYCYVPWVNILTKASIARWAQAALYIYDPFNDKAKGDSAEKGPRFHYQDLDEPKLQQLSIMYNLSQFKRHPDFLGFVALKDWLRQRFRHGPPPEGLTFHNFDSLKVLGEADANQTFDCGVFSYVYVQCVLSIGGQARVVLLQDKEGGGHIVSEVFSDYWDKWIVVDVDRNLYYTLEGRPLNALELHNAYLDRDYADIKVIRGPPLEDIQEYSLEKELSKYYHFAIRMRNDFFTRYPRWHYKGNLYTNCIQWIDSRTPRLLQYIYATDKKEDLYWSLKNKK